MRAAGAAETLKLHTRAAPAGKKNHVFAVGVRMQLRGFWSRGRLASLTVTVSVFGELHMLQFNNFKIVFQNFYFMKYAAD